MPPVCDPTCHLSCFTHSKYEDVKAPVRLVFDISRTHCCDREFMAALGSNDSLLEVDLAENLIGKQETQKV